MYDMERHKDNDVVHVYQEENEGHQSFIISNWAGLTKLATCDGAGLYQIYFTVVFLRRALRPPNSDWRSSLRP
jgi:hypothetical protein